MKRILIVDDSLDMHKLYERMFSSREDKYEIEIYEDARDAFKVMKEKPFDLVILDIMMAPMDGEEFFACARADAGTKNVPVLFVSVIRPESLEYLSKSENFDALQKPVMEEELFKKINKLLKQ